VNDWLTAARGTVAQDAAAQVTAARGGLAVLVTVAIVEGSGPREPGARMLVTADKTVDTIGGGHLEKRAIDIARRMLAHGEPLRFERFALGPSLGQCCGGVVHLCFEPVDHQLSAVLAALDARRCEDSWRLSRIDGTPMSLLLDGAGAFLAGACEDWPAALARTAVAAPIAQVVRDGEGRRWLSSPALAPRSHLMLFGAGHVGAAIVRALADLPCRVTWVDERGDMFPPAVPDNVVVEASDCPEALVGAAPPGASYLVMTHNHALDQSLTETIMARDDVGWFGLIGSVTKRRKFEHRLAERGVDPARIAAMVCPIGLPGIHSKIPAVIAASVSAQLLTVWEAQAAACASPLRLVTSTI
jgi:xanthine dehydrogenase accessory factor